MTPRRSPSQDRRPTCRSGTRPRASLRASCLSVSQSLTPRSLRLSHSNPGVRTVFGDRLRALGKDLNKSGAGIVGVADDDEGDFDTDDDE